MKDMDLLLHDLRSPLARAKTLAALLKDAPEAEREELVALLQDSLEELDKRLLAASR